MPCPEQDRFAKPYRAVPRSVNRSAWERSARSFFHPVIVVTGDLHLATLIKNHKLQPRRCAAPPTRGPIGATRHFGLHTTTNRCGFLAVIICVDREAIRLISYSQ
jgi:hypothetical protein